MKSGFKSGMVGFAAGLAVAAAGAQAAVQATQHEHPTPPAPKPALDAMKGMEGMKDKDAMMAGPATHQKMMQRMGECRDMMSMMMERMKHEKMGDAKATPHKH